MMTRWIVAAMAFLLGAVALVACDEAGEEIREDDPVSDLTLEQVVQRIAEAGGSVESARIDESRTEIEDGAETQSKRVVINVGLGRYQRREEDGIVQEELTFRGQEYTRDDNGEWKTPEELGWVQSAGTEDVLVEYELGGTPAYDDSLALATLEIDLNQFLTAESAEIVEDGSLLRITSTLRYPTGIRSADDFVEMPFPTDFPEAQGLVDEFWHQLERIPDEIAVTIKLWVSLVDFLPQRQETEATGYRGGEVVQTTRIATEYSLHNEAELPWPLPTTTD